MKKYAFLLLPISTLLFLCSCSTIIYIGKLHKPEINPDIDTGNIVFVSLFDYTVPVYVKEKNVISYNAGVRKFMEGLTSASSGNASFKFFAGDSLKKGTEVGQLTTLLPVDSVIVICARYKADMLLALDSMNIYFDWETIVDDGTDGSKSRTKNFYLYTGFYLSLYSTTGDLIDRSQVKNSLLYKSRPALSGLITIKPSIAKASSEVESLAFQAGSDYVGKFYTQIVNEPRSIYWGKHFIESNYYMRAGNWSKAIELLEQLVKSQDSRIVNKARQNLSVAKEAAE